MSTFKWSSRWNWSLMAVLTFAATPVFAQNANFDALTLSPGFEGDQGRVSGYTQGSFSLSAISDRDSSGNLCLGYATSTPDHIMTLQQDFSSLVVTVDSGGNDTTLVIQGPNNTIRCGDDTGSSKDARIDDSNWDAGTYRVWVGAFESGARYDYQLNVSE
jgi:hypothetical protein